MKIGLLTIGLGRAARPSTLQIFAEHCERLGFGTLWAPEHVVLFDRYPDTRYPYSEDGAFAVPATTDWADPFICLSYVAARTTRIRLATGICLVPEHNPLVLAKVVASLDHLSGGRLALGVGIGWSSEEFAALGVPFEKRAQRTREYIDVMRKLWSEEKTTFSGEFVKFEGARLFPKPPQGANLPIIFGGESGPALRRVADYGTGWFGFNLNPEQAAAKIARLKELMRERNRNPSTVELIVSPYLQKITREDLTAYHEAGVSEVVMLCAPPENDRDLPPLLEQMARDWVEPAARLG
ncbi:MAG TPA: LLM class F420-dependent oxidoreductase [Candidatus Binataceae bacterium]|nr:LLM class F420-dependent oxidoreductase [Candidatus Binataceae bacterium]